MTKAVVLLSGGADSATCLGLAIDKHGQEQTSALSVFYGQKHKKEQECARALAKRYGVKLYEVDLSSTMQFSDCPLLEHSDRQIRHESYAEQIGKDGEGMVDTFVPFRNGLMLSAAAALAMSIYPKEKVTLYYGAHADDAAGSAYPDCSYAFVKKMNDAVWIGSGKLCSIEAPFVHMTKAEIIGIGKDLHVPYELTWSCYEGGDKACGTCGTCIDRKNAFAANGMKDPIPYADEED